MLQMTTSRGELKYKPSRSGLEKVLGELELSIMKILWLRGGATVRQVHDDLLTERELAYTTVMTVMTRLHGKLYLEREDAGDAHNRYRYRPAIERHELVAETSAEVLSGLLEDLSGRALDAFVARLSDDDRRRLAALARAANPD